MPNRLLTYRHIADILSFESDTSQLKSILSKKDFDWDDIVREGSKHLVLPPIYCQLQRKELTHCLPIELKQYLEDLTSINRNRNKAILKQVKTLSQLFKEHHIDHVFLKGAALLASGYYIDIAERMIGDIDILVAPNQIEDAFELLKANNYKPIKQTLGNNFFEHKHLPRMTTETSICAVELHRKLFVNYQYDELSNSNIRAKKTKKNGTLIPSENHLLLHNILNFQIEDYGYYFKAINLKTSYDHILIQKGLNKAFSDRLLTNKIIKSFLDYHNEFFEHKSISIIQLSKIKRKHFFLRLKNRKYDILRFRFIYSIIYLSEISNRFRLVLSNSNYRKMLWKDRRRVLQTLKLQLIFQKKPTL